jgi:hypothetical protein
MDEGFERIRNVFGQDWLEIRQGVGHPSAIPVFIIGMPRSGTTLVEQILASHPQVFGGGEMKYFADAIREIEAARYALYPDVASTMTGSHFADLGKRYLTESLRLARQRRNDLMRMGPGDIRGDLIAVRQKKTGKRLLIPIGAELRAAIDAMPNAHPVFMWTELGEPRTLGDFSKWFPRMCKAAGLPKGLSVHGLRKATCRRMAEAGCSNAEIKAVTGHETDREVARYTKAADQERLARAAAARVAAARATHTAPPGYTHTPNFPSNIKAAGNVVVLGGRN